MCFSFWFWFLSLDLCGIMNAQILWIHPFLDKESISQRLTSKLVFLFLAIKFLFSSGNKRWIFDGLPLMYVVAASLLSFYPVVYVAYANSYVSGRIIGLFACWMSDDLG